MAARLFERSGFEHFEGIVSTTVYAVIDSSERFTDAMIWLSDDSLGGSYVVRGWSDTDELKFVFDDALTAFAFKMRWG